MPSLFLVHITLQFNRLPHSRTFYSRQSVISYFNIQVLRKNVTGYNVLWRNHYEDGYWSQDIHGKLATSRNHMSFGWLGLGGDRGWWSERGQPGKRWEWRKCRRWRWWWRWQWWRKSGKWWWIEGWNRWLRWGWDVEDGKQHEQGSYGEIFGFCVGGGAGGHQD